MFIICNNLDIEHKNARTDGVIVEECETYDPTLSDYVVVCREHKLPSVMEWVDTNMGKRKNMFYSQFDHDPKKAMIFVKHAGGIDSFTGELVSQAGGLQQFRDIYCKPAPETEDNFKPLTAFDTSTTSTLSETDSEIAADESDTEATSKPELSETQLPLYPPLVQVPPLPESAQLEFDEFDASENPEEPEDWFMHSDTETQELTKQSVIESEPESGIPIQAQEVCESEVLEEAHTKSSNLPNEQTTKFCTQNCIYNSDGSFKGFTEGQILTMLAELKHLDERIVRGTLDPDYILEEHDMPKASALVEQLSPSAIKDFFLFEVKCAKCEEDRIRVSQLLDRLATFVATFGGGRNE